MAILRCKMCGGDVDLAADKTFGTCESCGSTMTFPKVSDEQRAAAFNRGNHFRRIGEFDKALAVYEHIVREDENDAEAHWCCALCRFGIEYVEDPATFEWLPTCHRASFDSFTEDVDYLAALEHSDGVTRRQYQKDAARIAEVQRGILAASQNAQSYDVFLCYKESDGQGQRTRDSALAQEIYYQLTDRGHRVFFARITLEDVTGTQYEPYIFAALHSAKVMVVVGTKAEYLNAPWVKNEWSRFLAMMKKDHSKLLLPCYRDMDPYDLPEALSILQSYDMAKIGFIQDLTRGIDKVLSKPEALPETAAPNAATAPLLERAFLFLEDSDWQKAGSYFEKVLDMEPRNARAYLGKLLGELRLTTPEALGTTSQAFDHLGSYQKAIRFAGDPLRSQLQTWASAARTRAEEARLLRQKQEEEARLLRQKQEEAARQERERRAEAERLAREKQAEEERILRQQQEEEARLAQMRQQEAQRLLRSQQLAAQRQALAAARARIRPAQGLLAIGMGHTAAVFPDGTVNAEGANAMYGQCNVHSWSYITSVCAGIYHTLGLRADGTVVATGRNDQGLCNVRGWSNITAIASSGGHTLGLRSDGTVVATGRNEHGQCNVAALQNIVAIAAGGRHTVALQANGTVIAIGDNTEGQCNVADWQDIVAISTASLTTVGLRADGTVVAVGDNGEGQCQVDSWQNIVAICSGLCHTVGLKADGTVVATGKNHEGQCDLGKWKNVVAICAEYDRTLCLNDSGMVYSSRLGDRNHRNAGMWRLFTRLETLTQERWQGYGLCRHCGGSFKGLFSKTCSACGKPKDY